MRKLVVLVLILVIAAIPLGVSVAQDEAAVNCGTEEEVTITYMGDPVGGHPEAEQASIDRFMEACPNVPLNASTDPIVQPTCSEPTYKPLKRKVAISMSFVLT